MLRTKALPACLLVTFLTCLPLSITAQSQRKTPTDTVRDFYQNMRAGKFREAFALSIYRLVLEGLTDEEFKALRPLFKDLNDSQFAVLRPRYTKLTQQEYEDLRPDFERLAGAIPEKVELTGEQISGDSATVFVRVKDEEKGEQAEPVSLILENGQWIIGDRENQNVVKKAGKEFFFKARIDTHHNEVQDMMQRIALAQLVYSQQHNGQFGDLAALIATNLVPKDLEGSATTGYRFRVNVSADKKTWSAAAEPGEYGRTGKLSFFMDASGVRSGDVGGKPLPLPPQ